jgi:hypothetical protein
MLEDVFDDARTGMPPGIPGGAMCVQRFDDSLNSAIHTTYRISLRSSSMREPRDPLLKVLTCLCVNHSDLDNIKPELWYHCRAPLAEPGLFRYSNSQRESKAQAHGSNSGKVHRWDVIKRICRGQCSTPRRGGGHPTIRV